MFENLDQNQGQGLTGSNPSIKAPSGGVQPGPVAPKVEDMFAGVKDIAPASKTSGFAPAGAQIPPAGKRQPSNGGWRAAAVVAIVIIIIGLGVLVAAKFLGVDIADPASWQNKISQLSASLTKQQPGTTIIVDNETPAVPESSSNPASEPGQETTQPAVTEIPTASPSSTTSPAAITAPITATTSAPAAVSASSTVPAAIADSDGDGLSDLEEAALGSNPLQADTDGDSYGDKTEVINLYNPLGAGTIINDQNVTEFINSKQGYSVIYPKSFTFLDAVNNDGSAIIFSAPTNFSIEVSVQPNKLKQDIVAWYNQQFPSTPAKAADIVSKNGLQGLFSADKNKFYLTDPAASKIYVVAYTGGNLSYYNIFLMIADSLKETVK
jgi:hypothetical protein